MAATNLEERRAETSPSVDHETDEEEDYVAVETNDSVAKIFKNARDIEKLMCLSM